MSTTSAFAHLRRLSTPLSREAALVRSRLYTSKIPVGTLPQVLVSAVAPHRTGASKDLAALIFEQGGSIAATKKIMVEDHFAMMLSVWTPPDGTAPKDIVSTLTSAETQSKLGFAVQASLLDPARVPDSAMDEQGEKRRLKLSCPQRPGIVLAITELLKDRTRSHTSPFLIDWLSSRLTSFSSRTRHARADSCKMSAISADTLAKGSEIWFELEAVVDVPGGVDPSALEGALRMWTESKESRTTLIFDSWLRDVAPLSHA